MTKTTNCSKLSLPSLLSISPDSIATLIWARKVLQQPLSYLRFSKVKSRYKEMIHFEVSNFLIINGEFGKYLYTLVNRILPILQEESRLGSRNE